VAAEFKDGVLKVHLPKSERAQTKSIDVPTSGHKEADVARYLLGCGDKCLGSPARRPPHGHLVRDLRHRPRGQG
jgi:hypothetical protein